FGKLQRMVGPGILRRRQGYCLGLSLVLLDLTERLRWPMVAVSAPRHTFLRFLSKPPLNLETTLSGEIHDDRWYHGRFASGIEDTPLKPMSPRDIGAHLLNNHGFVLLEGGMPEGAARDFAGALSVAPGLVEAIINQGVCAARQGDYRQALGAFEKALGHWPGDPFTRLNRANAMISAGRGGEGALELARLLARHPDFPGLAERARTVRGELRPERDWASVQEISTVLNRRRAVRAGKSPGLRAVYFRDRALRSAVLRRIDRDLSFRWSWDAPAATVPRDNFSIRWEGWLSVDRDDSYTFYITCSDGVRIWIDGRQVLNAWRRANDNFPVVEVPLKEGLHDLRIEYFEAIGEAGIVVLLTAEREDRPLTLARHLWHAGNSPGSR
ncbi:MAG: PA14 domain-containing protein, partial [Planctomycetota bacterium]